MISLIFAEAMLLRRVLTEATRLVECVGLMIVPTVVGPLLMMTAVRALRVPVVALSVTVVSLWDASC